jgi:drug/metabolite transporter superfamily protein YnfA
MTNHYVLTLAKSLGLFVIAAVYENGVGGLMWQCLRGKKPGWWGLPGAVELMLCNANISFWPYTLVP